MTETLTEPVVLVERREHVLELIINRPQARNAVDATVATMLGDALEEADADTGVRAVILYGAGSSAFSAGADLKAAARGEHPFHPDHPEWGFAGFVNNRVSVPTIAAVEGFALGGGTELALATDLVVAGRSARFGLPEVRRGVIAGGGGSVRLVDQLPTKFAMEALLTGREIDADTMYRHGFVNQVVDDGTALEAAREFAARIVACAPLAVRASKRIAVGIADGMVPPDHDRWTLQGVELSRIQSSQDAQEGILAFVEKRPPRWQGA